MNLRTRFHRSQRSPSHGRIRAVLVLLACTLSLLACATTEETASDGTTSNPEQAAALVTEAKTELQSLIESDTTTFGQMADTIRKFDTAHTLDADNQEAAFYLGLGNLILFADSSTTTAVLNRIGLGSVRFEDTQQPSFEPPAGDPVIVGGDPEIENYVDLRISEALQFLATDLDGALAQATSLLGGLSASFTSSLRLPDNETTTLREFDNTDVQAVLAMLNAAQAVLTLPTIWNIADADDLITAQSERDPATGEPLRDLETGLLVNPLLNSELQTAITGNPAALAENTTAVTKLKSLFSDAFTRLANAVTSLLAETDTQTNDVFTTAPDYLFYGQQEDVNRFTMQLMAGTAAQLGTSFGAAGQTTVTLYDFVGKVTSFGNCTIGGSNTDTAPNVDTFPTGIQVTSLGGNFTAIVTDTGTGSGIAGSLGLDGGYWFSFTFSEARNFSVYTQEDLSDAQQLSATMYFDESGTLKQWDEDFESAGGKSNILMSVDADYFDDFYLPATPPTFYVKVSGNAPPGFTLHVDSSVVDGVAFPVFLRGGGGRTFTTSLYKTTLSIDFAHLIDFAGGFWDTIDRPNLVLDDESNANGNESVVNLDYDVLVSNVAELIGDTTLDVTYSTGGTVSAGPVNLTRDSITPQNNALGNPTLASTGAGDPAIPSTIATVCAQPYEFENYRELAGGYYRLQ